MQARPSPRPRYHLVWWKSLGGGARKALLGSLVSSGSKELTVGPPPTRGSEGLTNQGWGSKCEVVSLSFGFLLQKMGIILWPPNAKS